MINSESARDMKAEKTRDPVGAAAAGAPSASNLREAVSGPMDQALQTRSYRAVKAGEKLPKEDQLAWHIAEMAAGDWDADSDVDDMLGNRIIDNAGVAIAALDRKAPKAARAMALAHPARPGGPGAPLFGLPNDRLFDFTWAGYANAVAVRELDFHDNIMAAETAHPGDAIPTLLAAAQHSGASGRDLIRAVATCYETQLRLSERISLNKHRIDHTGHLGPAIASGLGALLRLDADTIYQAVQFAAHVSMFTRQGRKGQLSSWKAFAPGLVGKMAVEAIDRAMRGETSPSPVWEGDYGIFAILLDGADARYDVRLPDGREPRRGILSTFTKEHSAGYHGNALIDLAKKIRSRLPDLGQIAKVDIYSKEYTHVVMGSGSGDPEKYDPGASRETLDHSAMYIFAVALEDGDWHHERSYAEERRQRPETIALWRKVETHEDPEWNRRYYDEPDPLKKAQGGRVEITLKSGERIVDELAVANAHPMGETPFRRAEYIRKADQLFEGVVSSREAARFYDLVDRLAALGADEVRQINAVSDLAPVEPSQRDGRGIF